jgi:hypothetical protein
LILIELFVNIIMRRLVGGVALDEHPQIHFKEVGVLRVNESSVKKPNAIPDDALEALARCLFPAIRSFYESETGQREFAAWQAHQGIETLSGGDAEPDKKVTLAG